MARRMVPRNPASRRGAQEEDFGERFGNNYGYGREGERVEDMGLDHRENEYVDRYASPQTMYTGRGPYEGFGPRGYRRSDERIKEDICERLTSHGGIDARGITLHVENGEVTLKGVANNRQAKHMAEDVVYSVVGVAEVHNELRLRGSS
jgi:hypothetical protein